MAGGVDPNLTVVFLKLTGGSALQEIDEVVSRLPSKNVDGFVNLGWPATSWPRLRRSDGRHRAISCIGFASALQPCRKDL